MPSRPVRPPTATIRSPGCAAFWQRSTGDQADGAAEDQRIAEIALVETDGPVDGRNAHAIAVVAHAGHHAFHHLERMQHARRQRLRRRVRRSEAKDVGVADRLGAEAGAQRIADHAAQAGVGAAVGFDGRRMIVRFHLEADVDIGRRSERRRRCPRRR